MFNALITNASRAGWIFAACVFAAWLLLCVFHYWRWGWRRKIRAMLMYGFWAFFALIAVLIVLPLPEITPNLCYRYWIVEQPQTESFKFVRDIARASGYYYRFSVRSMLGSFAFRQALANAVIFVPLGVYLYAFARRGLVVSMLIAFACTMLFEFTQGTGIFGLYPCPYRQFDVDDLILNTGGALIGYIFAVSIALLLRLRRALNGFPTV